MARQLRRIAIIALTALALVGCQSGGEAKADAEPVEPVKAEPKGPAITGDLESQPISGLGFQRAVLSLEVQPDGKVSGVLQGGYDDKPFELYLSGEVGPDGMISATGEGSDGSIRLEGPLEANGFSGEVAGEIFTEEFSLPMALEPAKKRAVEN